MGLKETIDAALSAGFTALDNLVEKPTYLANQATSAYDPTTGTYTRNEASYTLPGLFLEYSRKDIDGTQIKPHDQRFLCQQSALAVTPTLQDRILRSDGKYWEIISISEDPAHATWDFQIRGTNG